MKGKAQKIEDIKTLIIAGLVPLVDELAQAIGNYIMTVVHEVRFK
jgi:hypothetical protein